jgi:integrase
LAGIKAPYMAGQAGHDLKMLTAIYAKWIPGGDGGAERDRLRAAATQNSSPILPQPSHLRNSEAAKSLSGKKLAAPDAGRRDWTRTNDPHHVKVVL